MQNKFFLLGLALVVLLQSAVLAQPELLPSPTPGTTGIIRMEAIPGRTARPEVFLKDINTPRRDQTYHSMPGTLDYGMINLGTFWLDVPRDIIEVAEENDNDFVIGTVYGFPKGIIDGLTRGALGAVDVATLGLMPKEEPLLEPEYDLADRNQGFKVKILEW